MTNYRLSSGITEHYTSFSDLREAWGMKPIIKKTNDKAKLAEQQKVFINKHKCKACGVPMTYTGGNIMVCKNPKCKGIEIKREDKEGNTITSYINSCEILGEKGAEIANNIFN